MNTRFKVINTVLLLSALIGAGTWAVTHRSSPQLIQGKPASYWMKALAEASSDPTQTWTALGPEAIPFFSKALAQPNSPARKAYLKLWSLLPVVVQQRLPRPIDMQVVRRQAALAFFSWSASSGASSWKDTDSAVIDHLISALRDEDRLLRKWAAAALEGAGAAHPEVGDRVVSALVERLWQDRDAGVRRCAAGSLTRQGESSRAAVFALLAALKDTDSNVRFSAAGALERIDPEVASKAGAAAAKVPALVLWLQRPEAYVRRVAAEHLAKLGKTAQPAAPALMIALNDKDSEVREWAAIALKAIDAEAAGEAEVRKEVR